MKKLNVILIAFALLIGTGISTAAVEPEKGDDKVTISQEIANLLQNPEIELQEDLSSYVTFTINAEHEIVVLTIDTENENVEAFIKSRLNYQHLDNNVTPGKEYVIPVRMEV